MSEQIPTPNTQAMGSDESIAPSSRGEWGENRLVSQAGEADCGCGPAPDPDRKSAVPVSFVYAIGRVEARFPNLAAEKEFAQAGERIQPERPTSRPSMRCCRGARTATSPGNCAGC